MTWWLRSCPRCGGDLYQEADSERDDIACLQCGAAFCPEAVLERLPIPQVVQVSYLLARSQRPSKRGTRDRRRARNKRANSSIRPR